MSSLVIQSPPAVEPVTLTQVKNHMRLTDSSMDGTLAIYLQAARELVESETGRSLVNKTYRQSHDYFPHIHEGGGSAASGYFYSAPRYDAHGRDARRTLKLLRCPLVNVQKITYIDVSSVLQTLFPAPALWQANTIYELGAQVQDAVGNLQQVTAVTEAEDGGDSTSGGAVPTWTLTTTTDHDLTWTYKGAAPVGNFLVDSDNEPPRLHALYGAIWPPTLHVPNAVQVFYTAGYGNDANDMPATLRVAVMQLVTNWFETPEAASALDLRIVPHHLESLLWSERVTDYTPTK